MNEFMYGSGRRRRSNSSSSSSRWVKRHISTADSYICLSLKYQGVKKHTQLLKIRAKSLCPPQIPLGLALD